MGTDLVYPGYFLGIRGGGHEKRGNYPGRSYRHRVIEAGDVIQLLNGPVIGT